MRIRVHLRATPSIVLPLHYTYQVAVLIYRLLARSSTQYATFLHSQGYGEDGRHFKLFTFSQLLGGPRQIVGASIRFDTEQLSWYITSPVEPFLLHLVEGLLGAGTIEVGGVDFAIDQVETLPEPRFAHEMRFTCLAPITMSVRTRGERWARYLTPEDPRFSVTIRANLERKYALIQGLSHRDALPATGEPFALTFDPDYLVRHGGRVSKLIDYKGIKIRGYLAPFTVVGPPELLRIGYQCGFGDKNSEGFGMVEVLRPRDPTGVSWDLQSPMREDG